jgi:DnaJ domain
MVWLILGALALFAFLGGLRMFERANVATIKSFLAWLAALGGLSLMLLLVLTGREGIAIGAAVLFGPIIWERWRAAHPDARFGPRPAPPPPPGGGAMTEAEAYQVLGLAPGASPAEIRAAHRRLMRAAHPDAGGSDWLAARLNQARDVLLGRPGRRGARRGR